MCPLVWPSVCLNIGLHGKLFKPFFKCAMSTVVAEAVPHFRKKVLCEWVLVTLPKGHEVSGGPKLFGSFSDTRHS